MPALVLSLLLLLTAAASAWGAGLAMEELSLPAVFQAGGQASPLEAVVVRPADGARHPLAVLCHGTPRDPTARPGMTAISMLREAEEFARRGFTTVAFLRRGYGSSAGPFAEGVGPGDDPDYARSGRTAAQDIREVIRLMMASPFVDPGRVLCVGHSAGGLAVAALASDPPPGLAAAIVFAPGKGSTAPGVVKKEANLVRAFGEYGRTSRVPMLFVYAENDLFFGPRLARELHAAFTGSGGRAELAMAPAFGEDGHSLFSRKGIPKWTPYVDAFLAGIDFRPLPEPLPARRAKAAPPAGLAASGRQGFEEYLDAPPHKAFVMGAKGGFGWASGRRTAREALEKAMENCVKHGNTDCRPVMGDDERL